MDQKIIALFDVDGTLTEPRKNSKEETVEFIKNLRKVIKVGVVGGSDLVKITEQLGPTVIADYDYVFAENGLVAYKDGKFLAEESILDYLGEKKLQQIINFCLHYIADLDIPIKRGTFVEFRKGMLNVSPIGRNCSQKERDEFVIYDNTAQVRQTFVEALQKQFRDLNLTFAIGGQISFDIFPKGWDKTFCLQYVEKEYNQIYFFGDKTYQGGNDHEIFEDSRTIGHTVKSPQDTVEVCTQLFLKK